MILPQILCKLQSSEVSVDSVLGPKALQIVPRLLDAAGNKVDFENAALETTLEVSSQGVKLLTSKNLMQNNQFKGFYHEIFFSSSRESN
jgi:hypothetical protein